MSQLTSKQSPSTSSPSSHHQWTPRSNISLFIHALHLLDLDLHTTWPNISESTYTTTKPAQNFQARVKATEWSLYHLFNLYLPTETRSRLSPHFPSATPIQSKNLRAGFFKWLTELKTNGVLPRECLLRKTMLDECRGVKFEEVLARFAMVVLRKSLKARKQGREMHEQTADTAVSLIIGYRSALQQNLQRRKDLEAKAAVISEQLAHVRIDVDTRLEDIQSLSNIESGGSNSLTANEVDALRDQVDLAFANDRRWATFIFEGTPYSLRETSKQAVPAWPFHDCVDEIARELVKADNEQETVNEPVHELQALVSQHEQRLQQLTRLRDSLLPAETTGVPGFEHTERNAANNMMLPPTRKPRFDRHQELTLKY